MKRHSTGWVRPALAAIPWCVVALGGRPNSALGQAHEPAQAPLNPASIRFESCPPPGSELELRCATFRVHENRAARSGRVLDLRIAVLPALSAPAAPDPLFVLVGGPGIPATYNIPFFATVFSAVRRTRDLVFLEQRGTGGSNRLQCDLYGDDVQTYLDGLFQAAGARSCRQQLEARADLRQYTTPIATEDLNDVRAALGYESINLFGTSYGTRGALVFLRRYPERVRAVILKGVMGFDLSPSDDVERAAALLVNDCEADPSCRTEHPRIRADLAAVLRRLDDGPVSVEIPHPRTAEVQRAEFRRATFLGTLLGLLQNVGAAPQALEFIRQAAQGDFAALARRAAEDHRGFETAMAGGMALSVFCAENPDGAIGPDELASACAAFPHGDRPPGYREPVRSTVPVLLISGFLDPITPPSGAEAVARHLTASRHVVIRNASHSYTGLSPCVDGIMAAFLETASVEGLDVSCVAGIKRPPLVPAEGPGR